MFELHWTRSLRISLALVCEALKWREPRSWAGCYCFLEEGDGVIGKVLGSYSETFPRRSTHVWQEFRRRCEHCHGCFYGTHCSMNLSLYHEKKRKKKENSFEPDFISLGGGELWKELMWNGEAFQRPNLYLSYMFMIGILPPLQSLPNMYLEALCEWNLAGHQLLNCLRAAGEVTVFPLITAQRERSCNLEGTFYNPAVIIRSAEKNNLAVSRIKKDVVELDLSTVSHERPRFHGEGRARIFFFSRA